MEFRIKDCQLQAEEDGQLKVGGYINVTERESEMLFNKKKGKWFKEVMKKGVFQRAINKAAQGIPLLFEHNWDKQLASTDEGSLILKEDNIGLRFDAVINDQNIYQQVKAGVINSCSFGFRALEERFQEIDYRLEKRFVSAIELLEVSLVKNPAYVGSLCETRSYEEELQEEREKQTPVDESEKDPEESEKENSESPSDKEDDEATEEKDTPVEKVEEEVAEEEEKEDPSKDEENRFVEDVEASQEEPPVEEEPVLDRAYLERIVEELIEDKINAIRVEENKEEEVVQQLETTKEIHREIEQDLEIVSMRQNAEVIKLRLELLKLKELQKGI